jgi:hypothetical protein
VTVDANHVGAHLHHLSAGYVPLGEEIWVQTTGGSMRLFMRLAPLTPSTVRPGRYAPMAELHVTAVEPAESAVLSGGVTGSQD